MEFTGRVGLEWRYEGNRHQGLFLRGQKLGCVFPLDDGTSRSLTLIEPYGYTTHPTLEEAKAALLSALGIVVEWESPKTESEGEE